MGKALLPSPFFYSAVLSGFLIAEAGGESMKEAYLPQLVTGEKILTLALLDERGREDYCHPRIEARRAEDGSYSLTGQRLLVPYAQVADEILVCANVKGAAAEGPTIFKAPARAAGVRVVPLHTLTEEKLYAVVFDDVRLTAGDIIGEPGRGSDYLHTLRQIAIMGQCAEMVGGMERVVAMTVAYVKERRQFGRPLGALQAVQHFCADMETYLRTAQFLTYQAASLLDERPVMACAKEIAMAKAWGSDAYKKCTWIAQQLHGGIGFTEEHDLHLYFKQAKAAELSFGDARVHRQAVAEAMGYGR
jgi:alkylation response protein AidB-like acyl-CoA dehydrogenase